MRGRQQQRISQQKDHPELQFGYSNDSVDPSQSNNPHLLDQAFIIYSDEEMMSISSQSHNSSISNASRYSSFSQRSNSSDFQINSNGRSNNILGNLTNQESSIYDIRQSECSQSGKQLLHQLEPLFNNKAFLRRSPRFAVYDESSSQNNNVQGLKSMKINKPINHQRQLQNQMIEDERSICNQNLQNTFIQQQKNEGCTMILPNINPNITSNTNSISNMKNQASYEYSSFGRVTRSSKKIHCQESESSYSTNSKQHTRGEMGNQIVSRITKEFIKKQKKIRKNQRQKVSSNKGNYKGHSQIFGS